MPPVLHGLEDVSDQVSFPVELPIALLIAGSVGTWRNLGHTAIVLDEVSEFVRVGTFVPDEDHGLSQKRQEMFGRGGFSALSEKEGDIHPAAPTVGKGV